MPLGPQASRHWCGGKEMAQVERGGNQCAGLQQNDCDIPADPYRQDARPGEKSIVDI